MAKLTLKVDKQELVQIRAVRQGGAWRIRAPHVNFRANNVTLALMHALAYELMLNEQFRHEAEKVYKQYYAG